LSQEVDAAAQDLESCHGSGIELHPDPEDDLAEFLSKFGTFVSVEAQTLSGGLGAFVASVIRSRGLPANCAL